MKWTYKAKIQQLASTLPFGSSLYKGIQSRFGRLNTPPLKKINQHLNMVRWMHEHDLSISGKTLFEVGTGHIPLFPIGFFLSGAVSVTTVDLNKRLDTALLQKSLKWIAENRALITSFYSEWVDPNTLNERLDSIEKWQSQPEVFLKHAHIEYLAPADAAHTTLPSHSIDYHFSNYTLEHIPPDIIREIFIEARRLLRGNGVAIHFVDPSDHFQHQDKSITSINFLRFSEGEWARIANNQFSYCNRLRVNDYLAIWEALSFEVLALKTEVDSEAVTVTNSL